MGALFSFCTGEDRPTKKELTSSVHMLKNKVKKLEKEAKEANEKGMNMRKINKGLIEEINELKRVNRNYNILLHKETRKTADIIMSTDVHLNYMDDVTEKKHIVDVLNKVYEIANL